MKKNINLLLISLLFPLYNLAATNEFNNIDELIVDNFYGCVEITPMKSNSSTIVVSYEDELKSQAEISLIEKDQRLFCTIIPLNEKNKPDSSTVKITVDASKKLKNINLYAFGDAIVHGLAVGNINVHSARGRASANHVKSDGNLGSSVGTIKRPVYQEQDPRYAIIAALMRK